MAIKNFGKFVDAHGASGSRPVKLAAMTYEDFAPKFRAVNPENMADNNHLIANIEMPLYNGLEIEGGQHGQSTATMLINFGTMSNMSPVLQEALLQENGILTADQEIDPSQVTPKCAHTGNTGMGKRTEAAFGTPVALDIDPQMSTGTIKITPIIDMTALATANYKERVAARAANPDKFKDAPAISEDSKDRLELNVRYLNAVNSVGAMSQDRMRENVARGGSQAYLMTASKREPDRDMYSPDQINHVADTISAAYTKFLKEYSKGCDGIHPLLKKDGQYVSGKVDKSKVIGKTNFPSFEEMGLGVVEVDGSTVLAAIDLGDPAKNKAAAKLRHENLPNVANAFNSLMSREFNSVPTMGSREISSMPDGAEKDAARKALNTKNLGLSMKLNMYMTTPQSAGSQFSVVQPAVNMKFSPYASVIRDTIECAQHKHDGPDGPAPSDGSERLKTTIDQIYDPKVLDNARTILKNAGLETDPKALAKKDPKSAEEIKRVSDAKAATQQFVADIRTAAKEQLGVELLNEREVPDITD